MLDSVVIEVRQHLCCANVFLRFQSNINNVDKIKFFIEENYILLKNEECKAQIAIDNYFKILPKTLTNLNVGTKYASFRVNFINFVVEEDELKSSDKVDEIELNLTEEEKIFSIECKICKRPLTLERKFENIKEYPNGAIEAETFFCHKGPALEEVLTPEEGDLYYGLEYVLVHMDILSDNIDIIDEDEIYCNYCDEFKGNIVFDGDTAKLWSDFISFKTTKGTSPIFASSRNITIYNLLLGAILRRTLPSTEPLLKHIVFLKVLLEANYPGSRQKILLIHMLEKDLPVLKYEEKDKQNLESVQDIKLNRVKAFQILYRFIENPENTNAKSFKWPGLVQYWRDDYYVLKLKISPNLFDSVYKELSENLLTIPETCRNNNSEFLPSYIFY